MSDTKAMECEACGECSQTICAECNKEYLMVSPSAYEALQKDHAMNEKQKESYEREIKALREALRLKQAKAHHHKSAEQIGLANKEVDYRKSLENEVENEFRCSREKG